MHTIRIFFFLISAHKYIKKGKKPQGIQDVYTVAKPTTTTHHPLRRGEPFQKTYKRRGLLSHIHPSPTPQVTNKRIL